MQKRKGISLIVLVITIIVMVILVGAIILTLNNSGIIQRASEAVEETNLATVREMASLKWAEAYTNGKREQKDLEEYVLTALGNESIDLSKYDVIITTTGVEVIIIDPKLNHKGIIPQAATYITGNVWDGGMWDTTNSKTYLSGEKMPSEPKSGDIYKYGDYIYVYNYQYTNGGFDLNSSQNGWCVTINDEVTDSCQTSYSEILNSISGRYVTNMDYTFFRFNELKFSPEIPSNVTSMIYTFEGCNSLTSTPIIPDKVTNMRGSFALTKVESIPKNVTEMSYTFEGCSLLSSIPTIPDKVTNMEMTFAYCTSLSGTITINANPNQWTACLFNTKITSVVGSTTMANNFLTTVSSEAPNP